MSLFARFSSVRNFRSLRWWSRLSAASAQRSGPARGQSIARSGCGRLFVGLALWAAVSAHAQSGNGLAKGSDNEQRQNFSDSAALFMGNNQTQGEQALLASNRSRANTAAWSIESAHRLAQMAVHLRSRHHGSSRQAAESALRYADQAVSRASGATGNKDSAKAKGLVGFINDEVFGNPVAALAAYREALALDPDDRQAAREAERLTRVVELLRRGRGKSR